MFIGILAKNKVAYDSKPGYFKGIVRASVSRRTDGDRDRSGTAFAACCAALCVHVLHRPHCPGLLPRLHQSVGVALQPLFAHKPSSAK